MEFFLLTGFNGTGSKKISCQNEEYWIELYEVVHTRMHKEVI